MLTGKDVTKNVPKKGEIDNKLQITECSWMNENEITRNIGEIFPILVDGFSNNRT
jgi:hypothetical protein